MVTVTSVPGLPRRRRTASSRLNFSVDWPLILMMRSPGAMPALLAGESSIVSETVFSYPGVGLLLIDAVRKRDFPQLQAAVLLSEPERDFTGGEFMLVEQRPRHPVLAIRHRLDRQAHRADPAIPRLRIANLQVVAALAFIVIGATVFGYYMSLSRIPQEVVSWVTAMNLNRWVVLIGIVVAYFVISMFMDEIPLLLLTRQLTFPLITALGFDPVWFGVLSMMMVAMGLVFPPVGLIAFIVSATAGVDLVKVYTGTSILMLAIVITTIQTDSIQP